VHRLLQVMLVACVLGGIAVGASEKAGKDVKETKQAPKEAKEVQGILIDEKCSGTADLRISGDTGTLVGGRIVAEAHTRECLLMPACEKSGYGVYTTDDKFLKFDEAGNRKALAAIKASMKLDDFEVQVNGDVQGDTIKVVSLKILP
jgi:hypothetical protein